MRKNFQQNFNSFTNIFVIILLFLSGLSYADTNGIWQFANDTRPGVFGFDEGAGITNNFTFINPVYFNLGLVSTGLSTFTDLRTNIFNTNSATIATQLTLTGFNCNANSKLRTDSLGNIVCSADNVNDADNVVGNEYPLAGAGITITAPRTVNANDISPSNELQVLSKVGNTISLSRGGGSVIDSNTDTFITTQTCPAGQVLKSVGKNSKTCVQVSWAEIKNMPPTFADNVDNVITTQTCPTGQVLKSVGETSKTCVADAQGITVETDPQVGTLTNGKWCTSNGVTIDCTSAAPASGTVSVRIYVCPVGKTTGVNPNGGAWGYYGCQGQITTSLTCDNMEYPWSETRPCTYLGKILVQ